jgi:hypothetical protein
MPKAWKNYRQFASKRLKMPKAWQDNITTSWFKVAFLKIFYNHINPLGLKVQSLIRIGNYLMRSIERISASSFLIALMAR